MPLPNRPVNQRLRSNQFFGELFTRKSNNRRGALEARNRREMGSPKKPSPNKPSPKKKSPNKPSPPKKQRRPAMTVREFANEFTARSNARRTLLNAKAAAEYAARKPNMNANAGSAANAAKMKRISNANNAALRAFFKKAANRARH